MFILIPLAITLALTAALIISVRRLRLARTDIRDLTTRLGRATVRLRTDRLTGLYNRLGARMSFEISIALGMPGLLVLLDLDRFKEINDRYSHQAGDDLLTAVGARLRQAARAHGGIAARLSGDEFLLLIPHDATGDRAPDVAGVLNDLAVPVSILTDDGSVSVTPTASAGICAYGSVSDEFTDVLHQADIALYTAKAGDDRHVVYHDAMRMPPNAARYGPRRRDRRSTGGGAAGGDAA